MSDKETLPRDAAKLRRRAEARSRILRQELARGKGVPAPENLAALSAEETRRTLHELQVHQIELEMQNDELRRAQAELDAARARYFDLYDLAPVGYCTVGGKGLILEANLTAASLLGLARGTLVKQRFTRFIVHEDEDIYYLHCQQLFETGKPHGCELRMVKKDGTAFWVRLEATAAQDAGGEPVSHVVMSDVTARKLAEEALRVEQERLDLAVAATGLGLYDWNPKSGVWLFSDLWAAMLGYSANEMPAHFSAWSERVHPDDLPASSKASQDAFRDDAPYKCEYRIRHRDGSFRWILDQGRVVARDGHGEVIRFVGAILDITERKRGEEQLRYNSLHDSLTGLPNRALLLNRLEHCLHLNERHKKPNFAVLFLDLDNFKLVNDSLGHTTGDQLLVEVARRLETCLRAGDTVARWGGDEFVILLEELEEPSHATVVANRIKESLVAVQLGRQELFTTASIGIVLDCPPYRRVEEILRDADSAMFHAKTLGGSRWVVFDQEVHSTAMARLQLESELRHAVERNEFLVYYQPILDLATDKVAGFEALVRWQHPRRGLLAPGDFLAIAVEIGLGAEIDRFVVRRACFQAREWLDELGPLPGIVVNANLMGMSLMQPGLVEYLEATLSETGLNAQQLRLELTEADLLETTTELQSVLNRLCDLKFELCLDDFGTGYSSLSYLERFPVTHMKIDRSFIAKACDDGKHFAIVQTIVALAQNLGMHVTAEGVETDRQMELVRGLKCEYAQGFGISVPLNGPAAGEWLRQREG